MTSDDSIVQYAQDVIGMLPRWVQWCWPHCSQKVRCQFSQCSRCVVYTDRCHYHITCCMLWLMMMVCIARHESILMSAGHSFVVFLVSIAVLMDCRVIEWST